MWEFSQLDAPGAAPTLLALRRPVTFLTVILLAPLSFSVFLPLVVSSASVVSFGAGYSMTSLRISFSVFTSPAPLMFPLLVFHGGSVSSKYLHIGSMAPPSGTSERDPLNPLAYEQKRFVPSRI